MSAYETPAAEEQEPQEEDQLQPVGNAFLIFQVMPSWLVSFILHILLIIILAVAYWTIPENPTVGLVTGEPAEEIAEMEELSFDSPLESETLESSDVENSNESELQDVIEDIQFDEPLVDETMAESLTESIETDAIETEVLDLTGASAGAAGQISGRSSAEARRALVRRGGGNEASENAVRLALEWIAKHQLRNGSWNFDHRIGPGAELRSSPNPGDFKRSPRAATAMCLLVFLGAGQTHVEGEYKEVVEKGLAFLLESGRRTSSGLSYYEDDGGLYNHGLAAIALCEAFAMTDDPRLAQPVQDVIRYVEYCQDPIGGGWRYEPKEAGDTSVVGWQIMALKSALMCGLEIDSQVIRKARKFLNSVSTESGTFYGYTHRIADRRKGTTAVGLLCQMYLGWTRENPALKAGVEWLGDRGPEVGDWKPGQVIPENAKDNFRSGMYYNYYATQVMHQFGGPLWDAWNREMRDFLIATQMTEGAARGSWFFQDPNELGYVYGGRLYATTLAAMTLEVYYRYLPLYDDKKTSEVEFELD
jgi:hypothetical protein